MVMMLLYIISWELSRVFMTLHTKMAHICGGTVCTPFWLRELDLNQRPFGYEPNELPGCSIPRRSFILSRIRASRKGFFGLFNFL